MEFSIIVSTIKGREEAYKALFESIAEFTKDYEIITHKDWEGESISVAKAWNKCAEKAVGEYLIFLNDDMLVTNGWAESMKNVYESTPLVGSLAFKVYDDLGNIQSRGHSFTGIQPYLPNEPEEDILMEVDYSDHPFVRKRLWERVGGFTEFGKMYYEDAGFGLKLQSIGYRNYYNPRAVLRHTTIGLRVGTEEDKKRRNYNETIIQKESKVRFFSAWGDYLLRRSEI